MTRTLTIAEIGQNHNGDPSKAIEIADAAISAGFRAVKLTMRDLDHEATASYMAAPYDSPHSFGATYGEHRKALELSAKDVARVAAYAHSRGALFALTICHPSLARTALDIGTDIIKVASRDLDNEALHAAISSTGLQPVLSTGMHAIADVDRAVCLYDVEPWLLHCVSAYPCPHDCVNLPRMNELRRLSSVVGYSDHTIGIAVPVAAVAMGATIIEKHVTTDRTAKGSDHAGSLAPDGMARLIRDIKAVEQAMDAHDEASWMNFSAPASAKLRRSVATAHALPANTTIRTADLIALSPGTGIPLSHLPRIVGRTTTRDIPAHELLAPDDFR